MYIIHDGKLGVKLILTADFADLTDLGHEDTKMVGERLSGEFAIGG
jgi:hypothetical protein